MPAVHLSLHDVYTCMPEGHLAAVQLQKTCVLLERPMLHRCMYVDSCSLMATLKRLQNPRHCRAIIGHPDVSCNKASSDLPHLDINAHTVHHFRTLIAAMIALEQICCRAAASVLRFCRFSSASHERFLHAPERHSHRLHALHLPHIAPD